MKRTLAIAGAAVIAATLLASEAQARVNWSVGISLPPVSTVVYGPSYRVPAYSYPSYPVYAPAPVYESAPVYEPAPVYVEPPVVYRTPRPVYAPAPWYGAPRPSRVWLPPLPPLPRPFFHDRDHRHDGFRDGRRDDRRDGRGDHDHDGPRRAWMSERR